jgi:hypothetical protein
MVDIKHGICNFIPDYQELIDYHKKDLVHQTIRRIWCTRPSFLTLMRVSPVRQY